MEEARQLFLNACDHLAAKRPADAEVLLRKALLLVPGRPSLLLNLAAALIAQQRHQEALSLCVDVCEQQPDNAVAWMNRGLCELALDDEPAALRSLQTACQLDPDNHEAHSNLAVVLSQLGQDFAALEANTRATTLCPNDAELLTSQGTLLRAVNRLDEAKAAHEHAIALDPMCVNAHWNLSLVELTRGNHARGFALAEWRWRDPAFIARTPMPSSPRWDGRSSLKGQRLLLVAEQGLGDTLQFCRFVSHLQAQGADVAIQVQSALCELLTSLLCPVHDLAKTPPAHDLHCPLMSLPGLLNVTTENTPAHVPYLTPPAERAAVWQARLGPKHQRRIGLVWRGNQALRSGRSRSLPVTLLAPLLRDDIEFFSLQKELGSADIQWLAQHPQVRSFHDSLRDFADTAALMACCDHVISIDTSVAHLAGAMGKPASIMLIHAADWRWGQQSIQGNRCPWYPTLQLFRQAKPGDWHGVIQAVAQTLS
ncbi:tetratricopeptide repeat-containing glycosyltransferase family protein [Viridibacterium curvum]|uniref:Tetratricopeptide repeat protein n=1 Tax=Viridibacterium curvum TaxID=1101404 RepID=A0ABP9QZ29_9RHOO